MKRFENFVASQPYPADSFCGRSNCSSLAIRSETCLSTKDKKQGDPGQKWQLETTAEGVISHRAVGGLSQDS